MRTDVNLNSPYEVRKAALQAVFDALGPVGFTLFMQQIEPGTGDYTKEKYERPEMTMDEIKAEIQALRERKKNHSDN